MQQSKEMRRFVRAYGVLAAALAVAGFWISPATGVLALCAAALFGGLTGWYLRARKRQISRMTDEIDHVLHDADRLMISESDEGELAALQSEIVKMTRRIREQNGALKREKAYLADSLADIAHQLRMPLTSVNMVLSFLEDCGDAEERRTLAHEAEGLLRRMDTLLTTLLKLSRLDAGVIELKKERLPVAELIENALKPLQLPMELKGIAVETDVPTEAFLTADGAWLSEAVQNMLKNGMESAGEGGRLAIACETNLLYTQLTLRDSGPGFPPEELPHVFERFYRGKHSHGFGVGLALAKSIIDRHGGLVTAGNHPEGGAVFTIRFYP